MPLTPPVAEWSLDHWVKPKIPQPANPWCSSQISFSQPHFKDRETSWSEHLCWKAAKPPAPDYSISILKNETQLTKHKSVTGELPSGVIGKLHGIHIDVLMAIWAHRLYDPPADLISGFLEYRGHAKSRLINLCQFKASCCIFCWVSYLAF